MNNRERIDQAIVDVTKAEAVRPLVEKMERTNNRASRSVQAGIAIALLGVLLSLFLGGWNSRDIAVNEARVALSEQGLASLRTANEQLQSKGLPTIPEPPAGEPFNADALAAATAAILKESLADDPRFKGDRGPQGDRGAPCTPDVPGCTGEQGPGGPEGAQGAKGDKGEKGDRGEPGADGVSCPPENPACRGPAGERGEKGDKGDRGEPGMPPCEPGYTPRWESRVDGARILVCDPGQG